MQEKSVPPDEYLGDEHGLQSSLRIEGMQGEQRYFPSLASMQPHFGLFQSASIR